MQRELIGVLVAELRAAIGYMRNAKIDLETGETKATAIRTIEGGLARAEAALAALTIEQEQEPKQWPPSDALKAAEAYIEEYEFDDCDGGYHNPSEAERNIMIDMVNGLLSEEQFVASLEQFVASLRKAFASPPSSSEQSDTVAELFSYARAEAENAEKPAEARHDS